MSTTTPPTETVAIGTFDDDKPGFVKGLLKAQAFQILLILIAIVLVFKLKWSTMRTLGVCAVLGLIATLAL